MSIIFSRNLIKGRIAEVVFEQMICEEGRYTVIPFGYEHTIPTLAQYRQIAEVQSVIDNISDAPDFALISKDKTKIYLVEVKFESKLDIKRLKKYAEKLLKRWEYPWLFVANSQGFYCAPCSSIFKKGGISPLSESWVARERQAEYLKLLNEFEGK